MTPSLPPFPPLPPPPPSFPSPLPPLPFPPLPRLQLQMLGYDTSWAAFNIIEVMSNSRFTCKRIGYLAATQSFSEDTDVIMLCTNLIRKVGRGVGQGVGPDA